MCRFVTFIVDEESIYTKEWRFYKFSEIRTEFLTADLMID